MNWLFFAYIGVFIWSITLLVDRYALADRVKHKTLYLLFAAVMHILVTVVIVQFFGFSWLSGWTFFAAIGVGIIEAVSLLFLFKAVSLDEITRVLPMSVVGSFWTLFLAWFFLGDILVYYELWAFLLFIIGGFFLAFKRVNKKIEMSHAVPALLASTLIGASGDILLKHTLNSVDFWTVFLHTRIGLLFAAVPIVLLGNRKAIFAEWKSMSVQFKALLLGNQALAVFGHIFIFYAISLTNPALVSASLNTQPLVVLILAFLAHYFFRGALKEDMSARALTKKIVGTLFVVAATFILLV